MYTENRTGQDIIDEHDSNECMFIEYGDLVASHLYRIVIVFFTNIADKESPKFASKVVERLIKEESTESIVISKEIPKTNRTVIEVWKNVTSEKV